MHRFKNALALVNPAAQNGNGARGAAFLRYASSSDDSPFASLAIETTKHPRHAEEIAAASAGYDALVVVGGDGVVHEAIAGLLRIPREQRPALALLPCGNGNDFARTLGMPFDFDAAFEALKTAEVRSIDIGLANGEPFMQTLSFGFDAAIALGTHERRKRTGHQGTRLFLEEGIDQLAHHRDEYAFALSVDGGAPQRTSMLMFAVQLGPSYGGGFKICPAADPCDGRLDYCIGHPPLSMLRAARLFLKAKDGNHLRYTDVFTFGSASAMHIEFDAAPPAQIDGELIEGSTFDIALLPAELDVMFAL